MHQSVYASSTQNWDELLGQLQSFSLAPHSAAFRSLALAGLREQLRLQMGAGYQIDPGCWRGEELILQADLLCYENSAQSFMRIGQQVCLEGADVRGMIRMMDNQPASWHDLEMSLVEWPTGGQLLGLWFPEADAEQTVEILRQLKDCGTLIEQGQLVVLIGQERLWVSRGHGSNFDLIPVAESAEEAPGAFVQACLFPFKADLPQLSTQKQAPVLNKRIGTVEIKTPSEGVLPLGLRHNKNGQTRKQATFTPQAGDTLNNYPLHTAICEGKIEAITSLLREGHTPNCKNKDGDSPLHLLIRHSADLEIAELLLMAGADLNARNHLCVAPVHVAVEERKGAILKWLLEQGAEIEARNNRAYTPLHKAAQKGEIDMIGLLLDHRADIHASMEKDIQPLHVAAWYGHEKAVEYLLARGADINATNDDGNCPLHFAAFNGQVKVIKLLMQLSADAHRSNTQGETYLQVINEGYVGAMIPVLT